jgi:hypothetical protein
MIRLTTQAPDGTAMRIPDPRVSPADRRVFRNWDIASMTIPERVAACRAAATLLDEVVSDGVELWIADGTWCCSLTDYLLDRIRETRSETKEGSAG